MVCKNTFCFLVNFIDVSREVVCMNIVIDFIEFRKRMMNFSAYFNNRTFYSPFTRISIQFLVYFEVAVEYDPINVLSAKFCKIEKKHVHLMGNQSTIKNVTMV